jgi:lysophospholipid acyltransferase (LPLAT)-like uncharacterized protein
VRKIKNLLLSWLAEYLGPFIIIFYSRTLRFCLKDEENVEPFFRQGQIAIFAFWHGRMFALIYKHRRHNIRVLVSRHRDGELISRIVHRLGYSTTRGSSSRGGSQALLALKDSLADRCHYAFTPDGPRGPREQVKPGIIFFAQTSGLPVIPVTTAAQKKIVLKTWDHYIIPKPFSKVVIMYGAPIYIPPSLTDQEREAVTAQVETELKRLGLKADELAATL